MNYRLVVLTHGLCDSLAETMRTFHQNVSPPPADVLTYYDGDGPGEIAIPSESYDHFMLVWRRMLGVERFTLSGLSGQQGFCRATGEAWASASGEKSGQPIDYVFWLEHDFRFLKAIDLEPVAGLLEYEQRLAQVSLMRAAVSEPEKHAGGLVESRPGEFSERRFYRGRGRRIEPYIEYPWLSHRSYFTTTPNLMRRSFMVENPWPDYESECEGRFGIDLVERGYSFGVWGSGEPWVEHFGERTGFGY